MSIPSISAVMLTKNSATYLKQSLESLADFDEVVIYDNGSTDETLSIARSFKNTVVHEGPFLGFGPSRNKAALLAKNSWIFAIDSDEILSREGLHVLKMLTLDNDCIYTFPRKNHYNGKWIRHCGWYPDRVKRLYNKTRTQFSDSLVHESVNSGDCCIVDLDAPLIHHPYDSIANLLTKMQSYSTLFANERKGQKATIGTALSHAIFSFFKHFFWKRGFLDGAEGFIISAYNAHSTFYKYLKLRELNNRRCPDEKASCCKRS